MQNVPDTRSPLVGGAHQDHIVDLGQIGIGVELTAVCITLYVASGQNPARAVGNNGPLPIRPADMLAYCQLTGRDEMLYRQQIIRFIPVLDRYYLKDFYDKQAKEMEKQRRAMEAKQHNSRSR